jgi:hypothetical protein
VSYALVSDLRFFLTGLSRKSQCVAEYVCKGG